MPAVVSDIVRQHVEQVAFFWAQRDTLLANDPPDAAAASTLEERIEINLDALRVAGAAAWPFIVAAYEDFPEKGELFAWAWTAIEQADTVRIEQAVERGEMEGKAAAAGLVGALAWHHPKMIAPLVRDWINAANPFRRYLACAACLHHRVDPKGILPRLLRDHDPSIRATALRLAGSLQRTDAAQEITTNLGSDDADIRFAAAWALNELGAGQSARAGLRAIAESGAPQALAALRTLAKTTEPSEMRALLGSLLAKPETKPTAVRGTAILGDRSLLHWLVHQMRDPALASAAGAAFLELFPEARDAAGLFTEDADDLAPSFKTEFGDFPPPIPVADKVRAWGLKAGLLDGDGPGRNR